MSICRNYPDNKKAIEQERVVLEPLSFMNLDLWD